MYFESGAGGAGPRVAMSPSLARSSSDPIRGDRQDEPPRASGGSRRAGTPPAVAPLGAAVVDWPDVRIAYDAS
jgi:hypothetical protein